MAFDNNEHEANMIPTTTNERDIMKLRGSLYCILLATEPIYELKYEIQRDTLGASGRTPYTPYKLFTSELSDAATRYCVLVILHCGKYVL